MKTGNKFVSLEEICLPCCSRFGISCLFRLDLEVPLEVARKPGDSIPSSRQKEALLTPDIEHGKN